jgi:hypothetical protein
MMKQVYSEEALGRSAVFKWHQRFAQGRDSLENDERSCRPKAVRTERNVFGSYTKVGRLASRPMATILRADVDLGKCM